MTDELLTIEDVARVLQVHERTVRRAIHERGLKAHQVAGRGTWRVRAVDLDAWLEERTNVPAAGRVDVAPVVLAAVRARRPAPASGGRLTLRDGMGSR